MLRVTPTVGVIIVCVIAIMVIVVATAKFSPWSVFLVNFMSVTISYYANFRILVKIFLTKIINSNRKTNWFS